MDVSTEQVMELLLEANRAEGQLDPIPSVHQLEAMPLGAYIGVMKDFGPDSGDEDDRDSNAGTFTWVKGMAMILLAVSQAEEEAADGMSQAETVMRLRSRLDGALKELDTAAKFWDEVAWH